MNEAEYNQLKARWLKLMADPANVRRHLVRESRRQLSRRARIRLWCERQVNRAGSWLVEHEHFRAARILWRI